MSVLVQSETFDAGLLLNKFSERQKGAGAVVSFCGLVRDFYQDRLIHAMTLEHYPGMTEQELTNIESEAKKRWPLDDVFIIHRFGKMLPGEAIVMVLTASAHRQAAYEASMMIMDYLKTRAPFWKCEHTDEGDRWVDAKEHDDQMAARWQQD